MMRIPDALERIDRLPALPDRPVDAHKGTFGTVIVVGGSATMFGAPALAAGAALRTGSGLVKIATSPAVLPFALTIQPSATGVLLDGSIERQLAALDAADPDGRAVLAVGPGLGQGAAAGALVAALLRGKRSMVLDADGLNLLAQTGSARPGHGPAVVMTPHPGEFARLAQPLNITASPTDSDQRPEAAAHLARAHRAVVLLKGRHTVVSDGQRVYINETGGPALATAGSGDVLTGVIASLMGQGMTGLDAAILGAHLHGLAGMQWSQRHGPSGLLAVELVNELPAAMQTLRGGGGEAGARQSVIGTPS